MLGPLQSQAAATAMAAPAGKILRMVPSDRMAGSIPVWTRSTGARDDVVGALADAGRPPAATDALPYAPPGGGSHASEPFGFGDILDMVNPLQHIPIVSQIYRRLTGDHIKPVAQVVGDGVFGGPVGAAAGLVNVIVAEETGKDIAGNVFALARGEKMAFRSTAIASAQPPENAGAALADLPGSALSFADMGAGKQNVMTVASAAQKAADIAPAAGKRVSAFRSLHLND